MSSNKPIGADDDPNAPFNQSDEIFICSECDCEMDSDTGVCSEKCFKDSNK